MARGGPRKADGASKKKVMQKILEADPNAEVPPMPKASEWIPAPGGPAEETEEDFEPDWAEPVKAWWKSIWESPMSAEFVNSDIHGLYMACVYLHESLNPYYKISERIKSSQAWEAAIKNYGLTPTSRESLRWAVSQGTQAQNRTNQLRAEQKATTRSEADVAASHDKVLNLYNQYG
jgi:hypothetical protein